MLVAIRPRVVYMRNVQFVALEFQPCHRENVSACFVLLSVFRISVLSNFGLGCGVSYHTTGRTLLFLQMAFQKAINSTQSYDICQDR